MNWESRQDACVISHFCKQTINMCTHIQTCIHTHTHTYVCISVGLGWLTCVEADRLTYGVNFQYNFMPSMDPPIIDICGSWLKKVWFCRNICRVRLCFASIYWVLNDEVCTEKMSFITMWNLRANFIIAFYHIQRAKRIFMATQNIYVGRCENNNKDLWIHIKNYKIKHEEMRFSLSLYLSIYLSIYLYIYI